MKKMIALFLSFLMVFSTIALDGSVTASAETTVVKKDYPTLPKGYEISQQFTYDIDGNCDTPSCAFDGKSKKQTLNNPQSESRYSIFNAGDGIKYDGSGFSFWYKSQAACTLIMEGITWLYLEPAPEGRWVTYYYQGKIFYDNDVTKSVKYKSDVNPDIRSKIQPDKKYNISFYRGEGDYYIDELFTFKAVKTDADKYENEEQAVKFSLARCDYQKSTSADYIGTGDENGSVELYPTAGLSSNGAPIDITYRLSDDDKLQFQKAVEIAQQGSGYLQIKCDDIICKKGEEEQFAKICITISHIAKKTNEKTGQTEYIDKKLTKWMIGSGSTETFLIQVKDISDFNELSQIRVQIYSNYADSHKFKFRLSPITVYHYPEDEIIVDTEWLKEHTTQNGEKLSEESAIVNDEGNDTNRQFLHIPNKRASVTEIELPDIPVGEYEVYANMLLDTQSTLYTLSVNNRIQNMAEHFQLLIKNSNEKYNTHAQITNVSLGKIKITKDWKDGHTKLKFISFYGSGTTCERTEMFISYLSFKKTSTSVAAEPSENFIIKEYPEPENYETLRILNDFNDFVRSSDNRYNKDKQVYGYVGDKNAFNLNARKGTGGMEPLANLIWWDEEKGLDGSAFRYWLKFDMDSAKETYTNTLSFFDCNSKKIFSVAFKVKKSGDKYLYTAEYNNQVIDNGDYDIEKGVWATVYYNKIVENGDLSSITKIGLVSDSSCYVDELHTVQQESGDIVYEKNGDGKSASVTGYHLRIDNIEIKESYQNLPVTAIKEGALSKTLTLKSVKLPSSVETIEKSAFAGDGNIREINLDNGVKTIEEGAFQGCKKLGEVKFSSEVTNIADHAFEECDNLVMVVPYNSYAYQYAVEHNINYRTTLNGYDFYKIGDEIHIADYTGTKDNVVIPEKIEKLPVTRILAGSFKQKSVKSVLSATVTDMEEGAFYECLKLETAEFTNLNHLGEKAFYNCTALKNVSLGDKITTIGKNAFEGDAALERITLPESLEQIDTSAFANCSNTLVADVVRDSYAYKFVNTRDTAILQIPDTESDYKYSLWLYEATVMAYTGNGTRLEIPPKIDDYTVVAVGENAFKDNAKITYVAFPANCKMIGDFAFNGCVKLENFHIDVVLQLGHGTFQNCPYLKEVDLTNVTKYWNDTFDSGVKINVNESQFCRTAMEMTDSWHAGINLGRKFETGGYYAYGTYTPEQIQNFGSDVTREYIKLLSDSGFDVIRFPITWTAFVDDNNNYTIDKEYLDRIQEIVDWIIAEDMYVIINTHHDSSEYNLDYGWLNLYNYSEETCKKYERIWEQICERFQNYDEHLIFESLNEPRYGSEWDPKTSGANDHLNDLQQRFYHVVRNSGGYNSQRYLMLETYAAALKVAQCSQFVNDWQDVFQEDSHLMVSVHFYNNNIGEANFDYAIALCKQYFTDAGIACVIGESAAQTHFPLSELKENSQKENASVIDIEHYELTGEITYINKTVNARDYDDWYVATWLDKFLNVSDRYGVKLLYWEDSGSMTLGVKGENPWWYFPSAIDVFMNHGYNITIDGEKVTLKNLSFTLPDNQDVSYYTNGKAKFQPGQEVKLSEIKNNTEIVSVTQEIESGWVSDEESHWKEGGEKQNHIFGEWMMIKEATCTEKGEKSHVCEVCDKEVKEEIPAQGHTEEILEGKAATDTEPGLTEGKKCSVCGEILVKQEIIPIKEQTHEHREEILEGKAATCIESGLTEGKKCADCGEILEEQKVIPAKGHTEEILEGKAATDTEPGLTEGKRCSVCGEILVKQEVIPMKVHEHKEKILEGKAATCTESGLTEGKKCSLCGEILVKQEIIPAKNHDYVQTSYQPPTTQTTGLLTYTCSRCGDVTTTVISKISENKPIPAKTAPTVWDVEKNIDDTKNEEAPKSSLYNLLKLRCAKTTKTSVTLKWTKVKGATGYIIYGNLCGKGNKYEKLKTVKGGSKVSVTLKKLKKGKYYKFLAVAVQEYQGTQKAITTSKTIHIATQGGKAGNYKAVKLTNVKNNKLTLKTGKSFTVKTKSVVQDEKLKVSKHRSLRYETTNSKIAKVSSKGKITAKKKGNCYIYVYDQCGNYSRIKVTVQ